MVTKQEQRATKMYEIDINVHVINKWYNWYKNVYYNNEQIINHKIGANCNLRKGFSQGKNTN